MPRCGSVGRSGGRRQAGGKCSEKLKTELITVKCSAGQHRVQGFLNRPMHHLAQMVPHPGLILLDQFPHRLRLLVRAHSQVVSASLKGVALVVKCAKDSTRYSIDPTQTLRHVPSSHWGVSNTTQGL